MKTSLAMKPGPQTVGKYMTRAPHTIGENIGLEKAQTMMRDFNVRHLPVRYGGRLVGVISDRDIRLALSLHPKASEVKVGDIMSEQAYSVPETAPLAEVARYMAQHKIGSAVVLDPNEKVTGVFTTTDALNALAEMSE
jgi:CBS domain-containing protein